MLPATSFRLRHGLYWQGKYPPIHWRSVAGVLALIALFVIAGHIDELRAANASLASEAEQHKPFAKALLDCMSASINGLKGGFYFPDTGAAFECRIQKL